MATVKHNIIPVLTLKFDKDIELECLLESSKQPFVMCGKQTYLTLPSLLKAVPILTNPRHLKELASLVNFMAKGIEYQYIENIKQFQDDYLNRIEYEKNSFDYMPLRLIDHGIFDVRVMHPPRISDNELVFFVKNTQNDLPYRVSTPYPIASETPNVLYQLLPYEVIP